MHAPKNLQKDYIFLQKSHILFNVLVPVNYIKKIVKSLALLFLIKKGKTLSIFFFFINTSTRSKLRSSTLILFSTMCPKLFFFICSRLYFFLLHLENYRTATRRWTIAASNAPTSTGSPTTGDCSSGRPITMQIVRAL